jgi:hypothetical protein
MPGWDATKMPKAVVGLSGIYDLTLRTPPPSPQFINDVDNYTNTIEDNFIGWEIQWSASPMARVAAATNIPPVRLYATLDAERKRRRARLVEARKKRWGQPGANFRSSIHAKDDEANGAPGDCARLVAQDSLPSLVSSDQDCR